jgi:hypothetical protein
MARLQRRTQVATPMLTHGVRMLFQLCVTWHLYTANGMRFEFLAAVNIGILLRSSGMRCRVYRYQHF